MMIILYESRSADSLGRRAQKGIYEKEGEGEGQKMRNGEFGGGHFELLIDGILIIIILLPQMVYLSYVMSQ